MKKWRKRFFLILGTTLYSFQSEDSDKQTRSDDLAGVTVHTKGHASKEFSFTLNLVTGSKLELAAADKEDRAAWIECVEDASLSAAVS